MNLPSHVFSDPVQGIVQMVLMFLLYVVVGLAPACGIVYLFYFLLTLPMRRNQRARLFLDLLELGLSEGHTPERAILDAATTRDPAPGTRFHLLAAFIEKGLRLSEALSRVPRLVPPQVIAMLKTGERIGNIRKVLPACRRSLQDGVSQVRGALNYLLLLAFAFTPFMILMPIYINSVVLPKYREVFQGMTPGQRMPAFTEFVFGSGRWLLVVQAGIFVFTWLLILAYLGGPRLRAWLQRFLPGLPDRLAYCLPWRRKRLQRDFSAMLSVLLDAEVPELDAVALAADATANSVVRHRAARVCALLNSGVKLPVAIRAVDDVGELQWRLSNALQRGHGFLRALAGWHEALDARAFQLEQTAAQVTTSALVILNGVIIACVAIGIFLALIHLLNEAVLW